MSSKRENSAFDAAMLQRADALFRREIREGSAPRAEGVIPTTSQGTPEEPPEANAWTATTPDLPQAA